MTCQLKGFSLDEIIVWVPMQQITTKIHTKLQCQTVQYAPSTTANSSQGEVQIAPSREGKMHLAITKEYKSINRVGGSD